MTLFQMFFSYAVIWWVVLFILLPFSAKAAENPEKGHAVSAPLQFNFRKKVIITSILSVFPVLMFKYLYEAGVIGL